MKHWHHIAICVGLAAVAIVLVAAGAGFNDRAFLFSDIQSVHIAADSSDIEIRLEPHEGHLFGV